MIEELRKARGLTQKELGAAINVTGQAVYLWESGKGMPAIPTLRRLAEFFGVPMEQIWFPKERVSAPPDAPAG
jgi:putative transcriptional regulator